MPNVRASDCGTNDMKLKRTNMVIRQRGVASIAIATVILLMLIAALATTLQSSQTIAQNALTADVRVQALFLAESGIERGTQEFISNAVNCNTVPAIVETRTVPGKGSFTITFQGSTAFNTPACSATTLCSSTATCRINSTGTYNAGTGATGIVTRAIESIAQKKNSNAASNNKGLTTGIVTPGHVHYVFDNTVTAGSNQFYALTVLWSTSPSKTANQNKVGMLQAVTYAGAAMTPLYPVSLTVSTTINGYYVAIYSIKSPPVGTSTVDLDFTDVPASVSAGDINLDGVDQVTPIVGIPIVNTVGTGTTSVSMTAPANGLVLDVLSQSGNGKNTPIGCGTLTPVSFFPNNAGNVSGESSYCGAYGSNSETFTMGYTFATSAQKPATAAYAAAKIFADTAASSTSGSRVRFPGGGVSSWREVVVVPP